MRFLGELWRRLLALLALDKVDPDLDDELHRAANDMASEMDMRAADERARRAGMP